MRENIARSRQPTAHNGLVAGSSPAGPTKNISILLDLRRPQQDCRTRNRTRYVYFSFVTRSRSTSAAVISLAERDVR